MTRNCPFCRHPMHRNGVFRRLSHSAAIQRFRCPKCGKGGSRASEVPEYCQKKRNLNPRIKVLICAKTSENRIALLLGIDRKTVARKKRFLAREARKRQEFFLELHRGQFEEVFFDELITYEHTRCKPVAIGALVSKERKILGTSVSRMPAIGKHLARFAKKRYGPRPQERNDGFQQLLAETRRALAPQVHFITDAEPSYGEIIQSVFPDATHERHLSKRASVAGQGELKTKTYDPLFPINHVFAMFRDNIASLIRRTWCTAKRLWAIEDSLVIYADFHNSVLTK